MNLMWEYSPKKNSIPSLIDFTIYLVGITANFDSIQPPSLNESLIIISNGENINLLIIFSTKKNLFLFFIWKTKLKKNLFLFYIKQKKNPNIPYNFVHTRSAYWYCQITMLSCFLSSHYTIKKIYSNNIFFSLKFVSLTYSRQYWVFMI
jgi:hypothetical protein